MSKKLADETVGSEEELEALRVRANDQECDELLAFAENARAAVQSGIATYPIAASFPNPPDVVMTAIGARIAVEATQLVGQVGAQVMGEARKMMAAGQRPTVEDVKELYDKVPARKIPGVPRSLDFKNIKLPGERLTGAGMVSGECAGLLLHLIEDAIAAKSEKFLRYKEHADTVWLFLIDQGSFDAFEDILADEGLRTQLNTICRSAPFDRIHYFRWHDGTRDLKLL